MPKPDAIQYLFLHCSDTWWGDVESIRHHHVDVLGWKDIGYHYVITNAWPRAPVRGRTPPDLESDGALHLGRDVDKDGDVEEEIGSHAFGYNDKSLGVCIIGEAGWFTGQQIGTALKLFRRLMIKYSVPVDRVLGHYESEFAGGKTCPDLNMDWFRSQRMIQEAFLD